jgi:hypothetical protein
MIALEILSMIVNLARILARKAMKKTEDSRSVRGTLWGKIVFGTP